MSKFVVDLNNEEAAPNQVTGVTDLRGSQKSKKRRLFIKVLGVLFVLGLFVALIGIVSGYFYWRHLKTTPQYSLALLVDAARRDDQEAIDSLVDTDEVVNDFAPQIIDKAIELYGRGVSPLIIKTITKVTAPVLPVIKQRVKAELPGLIREKTKKFEKIPFWAIAFGADRYLEIREEEGIAFIKGKVSDRLFEVEMKRHGDKWQIVALKDEDLAKQIARKIGQEIIALSTKTGKKTIEELGRRIGIGNLGELIENLGK